MYYICYAKTFHDYALENEVDFILFKITPEFIERLERFSRSMKMVTDLCEKPDSIRFYDVTPSFLHLPEEEGNEVLFEFLDSIVTHERRFYIKNLPFSESMLQDLESNVESVRLVFEGKEFYWTGCIKHTEVRFKTGYISIDTLKEALQNNEGAGGPKELQVLEITDEVMDRLQQIHESTETEVVTNEERAEKAFLALESAGYDENGDVSDDICDLLSDLRHYCHREEINFEDLIKRSENHFDEEAGR